MSEEGVSDAGVSEDGVSEEGLPQSRDVFLVGDWRVDRARGLLIRGAQQCRLEPRVMEVLVLLARRAGQVISKEEFFEAVWPDLAVEEGALSQCIYAIRKALGDDARQPRFVETVPRRGYRLIAEVLQPDAEARPKAATVWPRWTLIALALLLVGLLVWLVMQPRRPLRVMVLPFETDQCPQDWTNRIPGFVEQVRRVLETPAELDMISGTTSAALVPSAELPTEILRELKVDFVVQGQLLCQASTTGSVSSELVVELVRPDRVRIRSDTYDFEALGVESRIAEQVTHSLGLDLPRTARHTDSERAREAFQRGLAEVGRLVYDEARMLAAADEFERAIRLDPDYVQAWAELVQVHTSIYLNSDASPTRAQLAYKTLQQALDRGFTEVPEMRLAKAYYLYRIARDYPRALGEFTLAGRDAMIDGRVFEGQGYTYRRLGDLDEALEFLHRARRLDPRNHRLLAMIAETYRAQRQFAAADYWFQETLALKPGLAHVRGEQILNLLAAGDSLQTTRQRLDRASTEVHGLKYYQLLADIYQSSAEKGAATAAYQRALAHFGPDPERLFLVASADSAEEFETLRLSWRKVLLHQLAGQPEAARIQAEHNLAVLEREAAERPEHNFLPAYRAIALAQLGRCAPARAAANRAWDLAAQDKFSGPRVREARAVVLTLCGDSREAIEELAELLELEYQFSLCRRFLELDPVWRPLRAHTEFSRLLP